LKEVNQILLDLKRKIYKPVYFLSGEEPHYIDLISDYIENNVLDDSEKEFNQSVVYGKEVDLVGILGLARQFPMMSEYNVVIVKEAQDLKELGKAPALESSKTKEKAAPSANSPQMQLQAYLSSPLSSTILVFAYKYKTLDKRSALSKAIQ
jgi:DNA polymerase-3 subunit delta